MINFRFLFIYVTLFGFFLDYSVFAVETDRNHNNIKIDKITTLEKEKTLQISVEQPEELVQNIDEESEGKTNKHLSLMGIVATAILFLFVLLMLFKKEEEEPQQQSQKLISLGNANSIESNEVDCQLAVTEELVAESTLPMIGMSLNEEFDYQPISTTASTNVKPLKAIEPEMTIAEVSEELSEAKGPIVASDTTGKLTIVTSNTTEIDVVFELIQDLQRSSAYGRTSGKTELRRKAIWELGQSNDFRAIEPLVQIIPQVDSLEKNLILNAITQIADSGWENADRTLSISLDDESAIVRQDAVQHLNLFYQSISSVMTCLSAMKEDSDREVRQTARWALQQFEKFSLPNHSSSLDLASSNGKSDRISSL